MGSGMGWGQNRLLAVAVAAWLLGERALADVVGPPPYLSAARSVTRLHDMAVPRACVRQLAAKT